ncbi:MAG: preprotein translocase subunit SecG [Bacillota bacterium]|nr:preprotein translocase subunit SecG [Bacillota bacterium]
MNWNIINIIVGIIQILVSIVLIASVLMQSAKDQNMAGIMGGSSDTFFGKGKAKTKDAKFAVVTKVCAIIFLVSSLFLSYGMLAVQNSTGSSRTTQQGTNGSTGNATGGIKAAYDKNGNLVNAETGKILMTADEVAKQKAKQNATAGQGNTAATQKNGTTQNNTPGSTTTNTKNAQ